MGEITVLINRNNELRKFLLLNVSILIVALLTANYLYPQDTIKSRSAFISISALGFWVIESLPAVFVTFFLISLTLLLINPLDPETLNYLEVVSWGAQPIIVLVIASIVFSLGFKRAGLTPRLSWLLLKFGHKVAGGLVLSSLCATAFLSMWMSNTAAAVIMFAVITPFFSGLGIENGWRKSVILAVAFGANFGGMATPLGSGPNLIAMQVMQKSSPFSFFDWLTFGLPFSFIMLTATFILLSLLYRQAQPANLNNTLPAQHSSIDWSFLILAIITIIAWLLEPLHGISNAYVSIVMTVATFALRFLPPSDLLRIDWGLVVLIIGGLAFGELLLYSGIAADLTVLLQLQSMSYEFKVLTLAMLAAVLSAVASNTAATSTLIALSVSLSEVQLLPVFIALGASMGVPFVVSTPPNALAYRQGGLSTKDLFIPGVILMIIGCLAVSFIGPLLASQ